MNFLKRISAAITGLFVPVAPYIEAFAAGQPVNVV